MNWEEIQLALKAEGFDPGPIDGIPGRQTIAAVKGFQKKFGLNPDGIVGPRTMAVLFKFAGPIPAPPEPAWMTTAKNLVSTREIPGRGSNPLILDWADDLDVHYPDDDIPWCGLFVGHCIAVALPTEPIPVNPLGARNFLNFGVPLNQVSQGAVMVFWREQRAGYKGHVGFYVSEDATRFKILGGNQGNQVSYTWIAKDRLLGMRWPKTAAAVSKSGPVKDYGNGPTSTNEE